jgi:hypothetical protein
MPFPENNVYLPNPPPPNMRKNSLPSQVAHNVPSQDLLRQIQTGFLLKPCDPTPRVTKPLPAEAAPDNVSVDLMKKLVDRIKYIAGESDSEQSEESWDDD